MVTNIGICVFQIALIAHIKLICTHNNPKNKALIRTISVHNSLILGESGIKIFIIFGAKM
jgi:hypothetical protein